MSALTDGLLIAVFIYWGWDSTVTVNEETRDSASTPGKAAVVSTLILVGIYVIVSTAALAYGGTEELIKNSDDVLSALATNVFGTPWDKIVIIAVLTSAAASTQTTILPTARTSLSMARVRAMPERFGEVNPRFLTPAFSTIVMGVLSIAWYVGLTIVSANILFDSIAALGLMIAFYYGITGYACVVYYRRVLFSSVKTFVLAGVAPFLGGVILTFVFIKSCIDLSDPANSESGNAWLGLGPPLVIGLGFLLLGVVLMIWWRLTHPDFFKRRPEVVDPAVIAAAPAAGGGS
jgi:amino acid transporter